MVGSTFWGKTWLAAYSGENMIGSAFWKKNMISSSFGKKHD
jgi:hypothetical protein